MRMKKVLLLGALLLLTACTGKYQMAPENADVYIVDSAVVTPGGEFIEFDLRDVDDIFVIPVGKCLDGVDYEKGTIILVNEDYEVTKVSNVSERAAVIGLFAVFIALIAVMFYFKNGVILYNRLGEKDK